ncbi:glycosyltransferase [candidate division TA06 bacterium]|uniref:Glycosyltransferase n=1 Tax=candidate division TA06 bacterium TaxID=2250710 RepID=A0A933ML30_UNCT6|nr:glycosyltransferase [candidate division TA06 bacterium]
MGNVSQAPLVCICLPTYNAGSTIAETLESLVSQRYHPFNIFVVDNVSTDDTVLIVRKYASRYQNIQVHCFDENIGAEGNFNRCIRLTKGKYTAIYHSDDLYDPWIIEKEVAFLETYQSAGAVFTTAVIIDGVGRQIGVRKIPGALAKKHPPVYGFEEIFKSMLMAGNFLITPSAMVRTSMYRETIRQWGGKQYASSADLDVWLRIALAGQIGIINEQLLKYRMSPVSFTYRSSRSETKRDDLFLVLDQYAARYPQVLSRDDLNNYRLLNIHRDVVRSVNLIIDNDPRQVRARLKGLFSWQDLRASFVSLRRMKILTTGLILYMMSLFTLSPGLRRFIYQLRFRQ